MTSSWRLRGRGVDYALVPTHVVRPDMRRMPVSVQTATAMLTASLVDPIQATALRRSAAVLRPGINIPDNQVVLACLVQAIANGRLWVIRLDPPGSRHDRSRPIEAHHSSDASESALLPLDDTHWIEIQLVDEDGNGVPEQRYLIISPDGQEYRGYTDSLGSVRLTRLPPGECQVSFPDLDKTMWTPAKTAAS